MYALRAYAVSALVAMASLAISPLAIATHIPVSLDVNTLWTPLEGSGYLNFVEPGPAPVGNSGTEEFTGWVNTPATPGATGATADLSPLAVFPPIPIDNGLTHGDRVDFDFVVENRSVEFGTTPFFPTHPGAEGFLTWEIAPTQPSAHIDGLGQPHPPGHGTGIALCSDGSSHVCLPHYSGQTFGMVDVFSVIADSVDSVGRVTDPFGLVSDIAEFSARDAALDYMLDFCNIFTGQCGPGMPAQVFVPGWTAAASADDYVARWRSAFPATHVLIDPAFPQIDGSHSDEIAQIDAVVALAVPEPTTLALLGMGWAGIGFSRRRRKHG